MKAGPRLNVKTAGRLGVLTVTCLQAMTLTRLLHNESRAHDRQQRAGIPRMAAGSRSIDPIGSAEELRPGGRLSTSAPPGLQFRPLNVAARAGARSAPARSALISFSAEKFAPLQSAPLSTALVRLARVRFALWK